MIDRMDDMMAFLQTHGFGHFSIEILTADASFRRYFRGTAGTTSVVLMDAPPNTGEDVRPFLEVTEMLKDFGLSPPHIHASDAKNGFIIMEDFGDCLVARRAAEHPEEEEKIYRRAIDILAHIGSRPAPGNLQPYTRDIYHREATLVLDWYCSGIDATAKEGFEAALDDALFGLSQMRPVLTLRDYHAENLIWRPQEDGLAQLGLLDYQDALAGHPVYDLVSLIEDARRSIPDHVTDKLMAYASEKLHLSQEDLAKDMAILGAQRNLKIIGIFARLAIRDRKPKYPSMIPHVYSLLKRDLSHPSTEHLAKWCEKYLPAPNSAVLSTLVAT
ncbi:MAG: phosphotransferase [Pseudomonadota bacterium]